MDSGSGSRCGTHPHLQSVRDLVVTAATGCAAPWNRSRARSSVPRVPSRRPRQPARRQSSRAHPRQYETARRRPGLLRSRRLTDRNSALEPPKASAPRRDPAHHRRRCNRTAHHRSRVAALWVRHPGCRWHVTTRHRITGGDRQANHALWRIAMVRPPAPEHAPMPGAAKQKANHAARSSDGATSPENALLTTTRPPATRRAPTPDKPPDSACPRPTATPGATIC